VTLLLLDATGAPLGALPPLDVPVPWWQEAADVVAAVRARDGVDVQVLRLLHGIPENGQAVGGSVTYLAELSGPPAAATLAQVDLSPAQVDLSPAQVDLSPAQVDLSPQPLRAAYAEPGGPAASIGWAVAALEALGTPGAVAVQQRTWNLSAIWRLDAAGVPVAWLKQVPRFFRHEAAVLRLVSGMAPGLVPPLLAAGEAGRMLLAHVPGEDGYGAGAGVCAAVAAAFHPVQAHFAGRVGELLATGMPDRRPAVEQFARVAEPFLDRIDGLHHLIAGLPRRLGEVAACGLPDTLVHGDLHPGNTRLGGEPPVIMDWGDATVSHPAYDILRLTEALPRAEAEPLIADWAARWRASAPGSDPVGAVELMRPLAALRSAVVYADFLAAIEPSEHQYHASDVPRCLAAAVAAA
jgi:hypothetical protein